MRPRLGTSASDLAKAPSIRFLTSDHGVSEAIYLEDPDGNGVELYVDRPRSEWSKDSEGKLKMVSEPLDLEGLLGGAEINDPL